MARYRIGETVEPGLTVTDANDSALVVGTAVFGLCTGIGFVIAGVRARMLWLISWGAGLAVASLIYLIYRFL